MLTWKATRGCEGAPYMCIPSEEGQHLSTIIEEYVFDRTIIVVGDDISRQESRARATYMP